MAAEHGTFDHVKDYPYFELPFGWEIHLPEVAGFQITKFMVLQVVAGLLTLFIFRGLARRVASGELARGRWWNFWEMLAVFIRDEVVRPTIGDAHHVEGPEHAGYADFVSGGEGIHHADAAHPAASAPVGGHPADRYLPFVWSAFFYVLFCNLLGAFPWLGSATGEINVTGALAVATFGAVVIYGARELGFGGFWASLAPHMDLPGPLKIGLVPMIWVIELLGLFIRHGVLAVRLFANIMAGHTVIAVILMFIAMAADSWLYYLVAPASVLGQVGIGLLELFVAFLQAYIFAFLATLFIGTAVHPH